MRGINGYKNEDMFVLELNNKFVRELPFNMRLFIEKISGCVSDNTLINCYKGSLGRKSDIYIVINKKIYGISLKNGIRNSLHSESLSSFCFFMKRCGFDDSLINIYKLYHFGDGSLTGSGLVRMSGSECKKIMCEDISKLNSAFNNCDFINKCVDRFIIGKGIDYLVNGTVDDFIWISRFTIYKIMLFYSNYFMTCPHISLMCVQPKMRCLNGSGSSGRFDIQIKWYNIFDMYLEYLYYNSI